MKKEEQYAKALYESLEKTSGEERERRFNNFITLLTARGHKHLLLRTAKQFVKLIEKDKERRTVTIVTPKPLSKGGEKEIKEDERYTAVTSGIREAVVVSSLAPHLVGGFQVKTRDYRIDASYKSKLLKLYKLLASQ